MNRTKVVATVDC